MGPHPARAAGAVTCLHAGLRMSDGAAEREGSSPRRACGNESRCRLRATKPHPATPGWTQRTPTEPRLLPSAPPPPPGPAHRQPSTARRGRPRPARRAHRAQPGRGKGGGTGRTRRRSARPGPELSPELPPRSPGSAPPRRAPAARPGSHPKPRPKPGPQPRTAPPAPLTAQRRHIPQPFRGPLAAVRRTQRSGSARSAASTRR